MMLGVDRGLMIIAHDRRRFKTTLCSLFRILVVIFCTGIVKYYRLVLFTFFSVVFITNCIQYNVFTCMSYNSNPLHHCCLWYACYSY